jgi:hypothetical protein
MAARKTAVIVIIGVLLTEENKRFLQLLGYPLVVVSSGLGVLATD